jgi:hypothetical protein
MWGRFLLMYVTFLAVFFTTQIVVGNLFFPPATYEAAAFGQPYRGMAPIGLGVTILVGMGALAAIFRKVQLPWRRALWMLIPVVGPLSLALGLITWVTREPLGPAVALASDAAR